MPSDPMPAGATWLMEQWAAAFAAAVESMTEERPRVEWAAEPEAGAPSAEGEAGGAPEAAPLCWQQLFAGIEKAAMWVTAPEGAWDEIGRRTLRAAGIETAERADARNTYLEVLSQSLSGAAQGMAGRLGREVACERGAECARAGANGIRFAVMLGYADTHLPLAISLNPALVAALESGGSNAEDAGAEDAGEAAVGRSPASAGQAAPAGVASKTLDALLDVELPVSLSFGRAHLPIKEVLKLTTGSIVELNRAVSDPVEVIVNNCVIARGEVVVVEGNYGVRIQHILSRQDRMRSLK